MAVEVSAASISVLRQVLATTDRTSGRTHGFYMYPARFHPDIARASISEFSGRNDWVLDPFMGGGTSIIESLALGRRVVGSDINELARFVAGFRTRPLSAADKKHIRQWARKIHIKFVQSDSFRVPTVKIANLPIEAEIFFSGAIELTRQMVRRRRNFARGVLLRLGQLTLDCRDFDVPPLAELAKRTIILVEEMLSGLDDFVVSCRRSGVRKNFITRRRCLLHRSAVGLEKDRRIQRVIGQPRLILTSPPYPGVHVLYNRWQYRGRRETRAPYWIADVTDGMGPSYYCGGSRTPTGIRNYFHMIVRAFTSIRRIMHRDGHVVQVIGFSDVKTQLPAYLEAMDKAGFRDVGSSKIESNTLTRRVANRKWYAKIKGDTDSSSEFMLVHRSQR